MQKDKVYAISSILLIIIGIAMIYLGGFYGQKVILPPVLTGVGFFVIAWVINTLKK